MLRKSNVMTRLLLACSLMAGMAGCTSNNGPALPGLADRVELNGVPFYRGNANQSGSMVLASMLSQQGITITPGLLDPALKLPGETDRLQQNITQVAREYGLLVYPLDPQLNALLAQVAAGNPVLLRYSEGSFLWSQPRYALLVGYDRFKRHVLLRSGMNRRLPMDFDSFASAWKSAGSWAILIQQPNQLPAQVDRQRWLDAARETAAAGQEPAAARARKAIGP
ncbi:peptidase C39 family protein [Pseudomonas coleopterorum]|uniref:Peptidase C39 family protein n=1 Tax=Pseudomonas coleopterorum TaxID=1605838 RepID=A0AAJ6LW41_9PSED|nr:peptidase C39 family protein [Pseudomonas coleopterorum]WNC07891.1 peptidase C39 family protein [Pseudomonas coleopterorum]